MSSDAVGLKDVKIPIQKIAPLTTFGTRGGERLGYRLYPAWSENLLMLIHGVGGDSRYLAIAAHAISSAGLAVVVTPDLRGHGTEPHGPRASVSKPTQLEEDMEETLIHVRLTRGFSRVVWGGHSLGAALASRVALSAGSSWQSGLLMVAPMRPQGLEASGTFGGWISREEGLIRVNMPEFFRTGTEVLEYDESFFRAACAPKDLAHRLAGSGLKTHIILGSQDQVFPPDEAEKDFAGLPRTTVTRVSGSHLGVVATPAALQVLSKAVEDLFA